MGDAHAGSMMWNTGFGMGPGMWLVMAVGTVVFWVVVVLAVRALLGAGPHVRHAVDPAPRDHDVVPGAEQVSAHPERQAPLAVLQDRLARGEIDVDEYARIRRALVESQPALPADTTHPGTRGGSSQG
jgi:putative membrane protein